MVAVGIGFHATLVSAVTQSYNGDPLDYLFLLPLWGFVLVLGTHLHRGQELPIHDRQIDWILALAVAGLIVMLDALLRPRLGATAQLVRIDIFALLLFLICGSILLFGLRTTGRYWATWLFLFACSPLLYRFAGAALGGTTKAYGLLNVALTAIVVVIATGPPARRRLLNGVLTLVVGIVAVEVLAHELWLPSATQLLPSVLALVAVVAVEVRREPEGVTVLGTPANPHGAVKKPVLAGAAFLVFGGLLGAFADLTPVAPSPDSLAHAHPAWTTTAVVPAGWKTLGRRSYDWPPPYFGLGSTWYRYQFVPTTTGPVSNRVVVDALTVGNLGPLDVYPAINCYKLPVAYLESPDTIDLGHGVAATLFYANSASAAKAANSQWVMLTWTWRIHARGTTYFQRLNVLTLDGQAGVAGFPVPTAPGTNDSVRTTFSDILRGVSTPSSPQPSASTVDRLVSFSRAVVDHQAVGG